MLVGYVSDEYFAAISNVLVEFASPDGIVQARSSASGAVAADLMSGTYEVTLARPGFSAKRTSLSVRPGEVRQFRLLSTSPSGYAWPKWVRAGESSELCINCAEPFSIELWRYGLEPEHVRDVGYWDNHPPGAMQQILPDGDFTQTGAQWSRHGYAFPSFDPRTSVAAPERSGLYYFHAGGRVRRVLLVPVDRGARRAVRAGRRPRLEHHVERLQRLRRPQQLHRRRLGCRPRRSSTSRQEACCVTPTRTWQAWSGGDYPPLSFDRPEPLNRVVSRRADHRPACVGRR